MVVHPKDEGRFNIRFLSKAVSAIDYHKVITGSAQPQITRSNLRKVSIFIPPLSVQQYIANELDAVQSMIDSYRQQLADLDALAQSLFIDMFGNVVINDKDWHIVPMHTLGNFKNGINYSKSGGKHDIKVLGVGDFKDHKVLSCFSQIPSIVITKVSEEYLLHDEDIVFVRSNGNKNLVGRCLEVYPHDTCITYSGFCVRFRKTSQVLNKYLIALLTNEGFKNAYVLRSNGIGIQNINQKLLGNLPIPLPPLSLQNQFAARIEAIERQKQLYRQQLQDAETLMAERMQYYFS